MNEVVRPRPNIVKRVCAGGSVEHAWLPPLPDARHVSASAPSGICVCFSRLTACVVSRGGRTSRRDLSPGSLSITGPDPVYWLRVREPSDVVEITASPSVRLAIAEEMGVPEASDLDHIQAGGDSIGWAIAARLRTSLRGHADFSDLESEELVWHLYRHVFASHFGGRLPRRGDGKLARGRLRRVIAYIEEHLTSRDLSIAVLAEVAALSPFHFLRSFGRTLHMTPHGFVRARRLEHARAALQSGSDAVDVAQRYGFTHLRHFRSQFREHHGFAPGEEVIDVLTADSSRRLLS